MMIQNACYVHIYILVKIGLVVWMLETTYWYFVKNLFFDLGDLTMNISNENSKLCFLHNQNTFSIAY